MAVPFSQLVATTYDEAVNERDKAANQFADDTYLGYLEANGGVKQVSGSNALSLTLDYQRNPGVTTLASDFDPTSTSKTEVITQAQFAWVPVIVPVNWSITDEYLNSDANAKIDLVSGLVDNAMSSHDDYFEQIMLSTSTDGFLGLQNLITTDGTGTIGQIVAGTETWWKNQFEDFTDASALLTDLGDLHNACAKGSGSKLKPNVVVCDDAAYSVYEGKLITNQRFSNAKKASGGFVELQFRNADVIFSKYAPTEKYYMLNTKNLKLYTVKGAFRRRRTPVEHTNAAAMNMKVVSIAQQATNNRSRLGVAFT